MKTKLAYVTLRTGLAVALAALSMVVGCGNDALPFSELRSSVITAACRYEVLCQDYPDQATCLASTETQPHFFDTMEADIASGKVIYDGVSARACVDAIDGLSTCTRDAFSKLSVSTAVCNKVFTGTVAVGGSCFFSEECVGGGDCLSTGSCTSYQCCAGACQTPPVTVPPGGICPGSGPSVCAPGTTCVVDSSGNSTCRAPVGVGGSCSVSAVCASGLYCDLLTTQTCKPLVATGGRCDPQVGSPDCKAAQDVCDPTTSVCTAPLAVGSSCVNSPEPCVSYASCDATSGTCVERPPVGAACDPTYGPSCLAGNCDTTSASCVLPPDTGACS
jgi:hypothetical protein